MELDEDELKATKNMRTDNCYYCSTLKEKFGNKQAYCPVVIDENILGENTVYHYHCYFNYCPVCGKKLGKGV